MARVRKKLDMFKKNKRYRIRKHLQGLVSPTEQYPSPRKYFEQVFDIVQLSSAYKDSKTFVDAIPLKRPAKIKKLYLKHYSTQLDIRSFVDAYFERPSDPGAESAKLQTVGEFMPLRPYIEAMWKILTKAPNKSNKYDSLLPLPYPYVVPGGRFREVYYWDSYFTMLGLKESNEYDLIESMVKNFVHLIDIVGFIPNGNRTYYLTRSQPPMFAKMVDLLASIKGEHILVEYRDHIVKEYEFWMRGKSNRLFKKQTTNACESVVRMPDGSILNRYWDSSVSPREESFVEDLELGRRVEQPAQFYRNMRAGAASGWDYSSRWLKNTEEGLTSIQTTNIVPIDLNVLLLQMEEILEKAYQIDGTEKQSKIFATRAHNRREAIQRYLWDDEAGWYKDYLSSEEQVSNQKTIAGAYALYGGVATPEQASKMVKVLEDTFLRPGGLVTTTVQTGEQWDAPNGWAPLHYIAIMGLERYGATDTAETIARRWCELNISWYHKTGRLYEKYNVENTEALAGGGEYVIQDGFGWTNAVLLLLINKYHITC